ncbi:hypothetical protein E2K73_13920 [Acinetobacter sp. RF15A]|jgi:hypothetical protein|uniref:hypothetical protein n=1 Tax=unclassified Acinetobacter TaxID=196816 RepID=UPI001195406E|nr:MULTISPECIES: hypothetical protein [Gammaproteobacteria]KAA0605227.1 hypothetical protein E2K75_30410 [Escherichia coli]TSH68263.1 hypothetical protein E2K73_13920 [Acinetobacter sp. RF15A]TSI14047.1 hypothetical protein E2K74_13970 [Acinetobacter sp. RF15B]
MNSELEDLELDALLEDLQRDSDELDKLYLEFDKIDAELDRLLGLDEKNLRKLESIRQIRSLKRALEVLTSAVDRPAIDKRQFFIVLNKISSSFFKLKKLSKKTISINHFKHLIEIFQTIKHENHLVLLQPRLQSINSIKA